jgi:hypothetical protein
MVEKSGQAYCTIFDKIEQWARDHNRRFRPPILRIDFETGMIAAAQQALRHTRISGCYFHYCQAIYRMVCEGYRIWHFSHRLANSVSPIRTTRTMNSSDMFVS